MLVVVIDTYEEVDSCVRYEPVTMIYPKYTCVFYCTLPATFGLRLYERVHKAGLLGPSSPGSMLSQ